MTARRTPIALLAAALLWAACTSESGPGTVIGQLYIVLQSGNMAAIEPRPVRLIPESARLDSTISVLCIRRDREVAQLKTVADSILNAHAANPPAEDSAFQRVLAQQVAATTTAMRDRDRLLEKLALRSVETGPDATFVFENVPAGKYRLWADALLSSGRWNWLLPIEVKPGDSLHVSLNNTTSDDDPLKCPTPLGE
jgi:hypothetical protein